MVAPRLDEAALVLFSGGQDSTTCLAWALNRFSRVETIGFDYGQRHRVELECRPRILDRLAQAFPMWAPRLGPDHTVSVGALNEISDSALTRDAEIAMDASGLPTTFVPGRNLIFLCFAAALAYRRHIRHIVAGMCETDFSGYPDCRDDTLKAMQVALSLGMERRFVLHTPLMWIDQAATWALAEELGDGELLRIITEETQTCYRGARDMRHEWGYGCDDCPACALRAKGYEAFRAKQDANRERDPAHPAVWFG